MVSPTDQIIEGEGKLLITAEMSSKTDQHAKGKADDNEEDEVVQGVLVGPEWTARFNCQVDIEDWIIRHHSSKHYVRTMSKPIIRHF